MIWIGCHLVPVQQPIRIRIVGDWNRLGIRSKAGVLNDIGKAIQIRVIPRIKIGRVEGRLIQPLPAIIHRIAVGVVRGRVRQRNIRLEEVAESIAIDVIRRVRHREVNIA